MPLIFNRSLIGTEAAELETIVTIDSRTYSVSSYTNLYANSYTIVKDELGIVGSQNTYNYGGSYSQFNYLTLSPGTYNFQMIAIGSGWNRVYSYFAGIGRVTNSGGSAAINMYQQIIVSGNGAAPTTMSYPSLPTGFTRTISSSTDEGLFAYASNVYSGIPSRMDYSTWKITAV